MPTWGYWFRLTKGGKPAADWLDVARRNGYAVDAPDAPVFFDQPLGHNDRLLLKNLPHLRGILSVAPAAWRLGVPQVGHFGTSDIWFEVAAAFARKGVVIHDCLTDQLFDFGNDPGAAAAGALLVRKQAALAKTEAARRASADRKRGRTILSGEALQHAMAQWGSDDDRSAEQVAADVGVGVATMYRMMVDADGNRVGRVAAIGLAKQDLWPPGRSAND